MSAHNIDLLFSALSHQSCKILPHCGDCASSYCVIYQSHTPPCLHPNSFQFCTVHFVNSPNLQTEMYCKTHLHNQGPLWSNIYFFCLSNSPNIDLMCLYLLSLICLSRDPAIIITTIQSANLIYSYQFPSIRLCYVLPQLYSICP